MNVFKENGLSKKEEAQIFGMFQEVNDVYSDFYVTKDNLRLFIRDNPNVLFEGLKKGDKIALNEKGILVVVGYSDNSPRKYLKILVRELKDVDGLLKTIYWNIKTDVYCKVKNNNPLKDVLLHNGFKFIGGRGKEVLLVHNYINRPQPDYTRFNKDGDE
jgi:hypothetical protein